LSQGIVKPSRFRRAMSPAAACASVAKWFPASGARRGDLAAIRAQPGQACRGQRSTPGSKQARTASWRRPRTGRERLILAPLARRRILLRTASTASAGAPCHCVPGAWSVPLLPSSRRARCLPLLRGTIGRGFSVCPSGLVLWSVQRGPPRGAQRPGRGDRQRAQRGMSQSRASAARNARPPDRRGECKPVRTPDAASPARPSPALHRPADHVLGDRLTG